MGGAATTASYRYCEDLVRRGDKDRFLASLFAPEAERRHLFALYAFNLEVARIRDVVSDALPGEMRLQWWRDALAGCGHGEVGRHPVAAALIETVEACDLSRQPLLDLIEARAFDLYDDPMHSVADFEAYCRATSSQPMALATEVLGARGCNWTASMVDHGGIAYAITGLLRAMPFHASRGQIFLPDDVMTRHGARREDIFSGTASPELSAVRAELRQLAWQHLDRAGYCIGEICRQAVPAILPIALVRPYLERMDRPDYKPFEDRCVVPQWRRQWILWNAARKATKVC